MNFKPRTKYIFSYFVVSVAILLSIQNRVFAEDNIKMMFSLQRTDVSKASLAGAMLYPIFTFENLTSEPIYVYHGGLYGVNFDSTHRKIELIFSLGEVPPDMTYYASPYPNFFEVSANSKLTLYFRIDDFYDWIKDYQVGEYSIQSKLGYLNHKYYFEGLFQYDNRLLRNEITTFQKLLKSNELRINITN